MQLLNFYAKYTQLYLIFCENANNLPVTAMIRGQKCDSLADWGNKEFPLVYDARGHLKFSTSCVKNIGLDVKDELPVFIS